MELSKKKYTHRVKGRAQVLVDDDKGMEGEVGMGSHTLFCPFLVDFDGRIRWVLHARAHSCAWGLRPKWRPWGFRPAELDVETLRRFPKPEVVNLEVIARIVIPSDLREAWRCAVDVDATLPLRYPVNEWVGEAIRLKGKLVFRGERYSRRVGPVLQWYKERLWVLGGVPDRSKIGPLRFRGRATSLTRVGAELMSLNLRWLPDGSSWEQHSPLVADEDEGAWSQLTTLLSTPPDYGGGADLLTLHRPARHRPTSRMTSRVSPPATKRGQHRRLEDRGNESEGNSDTDSESEMEKPPERPVRAAQKLQLAGAEEGGAAADSNDDEGEEVTESLETRPTEQGGARVRGRRGGGIEAKKAKDSTKTTNIESSSSGHEGESSVSDVAVGEVAEKVMGGKQFPDAEDEEERSDD